MALPCND